MSKKVLLLTLSLTATVFLAASSFGQCSSGVTPHYVGIGSSAQFNTLAFGADQALTHLPNNGAINIWSSKAAQVTDARVSKTDTGLSIWVIYDSGATCNLYVGYQADSVQGVKDFYCAAKVPTGFVGSRSGCYGFSTGAGSWEQLACVNVVPGLPCQGNLTGGLLPAAVQTFLTTQPTPTKTGTTQNNAPAYCGQTLGTAGKVEPDTFYCYFNAAHTDVRDEDALYATTRALSSYNTTNSMYGLGYNSAACGASGTGTKVVGCPILDSFNKGKIFYVLNFALKGTDPYTAAVVPTNTTLTLGASPIVVFVNNADADSLGFGVKQGDGSYLHKDVNHKVLAQIFEGVDSCTGDLIATTPTPSLFGGSVPGSGQPIQAVVREPLSGTYNTFEFTGVRTFSGSGLTPPLVPTGHMIGLNNVTTASTGSGPAWVSDQESSQEMDVRGTLPEGPATGWSAGTNSTHCAPFADGTINCGDPLYYETGPATGAHGPNGCPASGGSPNNPALKLRAIGTGEEVAATLGQDNIGGATWEVKDGIGYSFWGYSNFAPGASGCETASSNTTGDVTCSTYNGHYLTVDAIDPLFETEGGSFSPTLGSNPENPNGAYNFPQCGAIQKAAGYVFPCQQIPFYHLYDGKYPLWSMLRIVTFANVAAGVESGQQTPEGVINVVGYAQQQAAPGTGEQLSDFAPFLRSVAGLPYTQGGTLPTGSLNIGVFRVHYLQSTVLPDNGHVGCAPGFNFTGVQLQGGTKGSSTCLVDTGGDVGGSVKTVQADVDFYLDLGGVTVNSVHYPNEIYDLRQ